MTDDTPILANETLAAEYADKIGLANMARDIAVHLGELHGVVSTMPKELRDAWAVMELVKCQTSPHLHLTHQQIERVERILARAKDTEFAKEMAKHRLECSSTLRWWISSAARFPMSEAI